MLLQVIARRQESTSAGVEDALALGGGGGRGRGNGCGGRMERGGVALPAHLREAAPDAGRGLPRRSS